MKDVLHKILFPSKEKQILQLKEANNEWARNSLKTSENLEKIYDENKHIFDLLVVKEFVGHIPKEVSEPILKIFEDQGEMFERWILWQSWYINRKAMNDPVKIGFYNGMMVYLKVLYTIANVNKKSYVPTKPVQEFKSEIPWVDKAIDGVNQFRKAYENNKTNQNSSESGNENS